MLLNRRLYNTVSFKLAMFCIVQFLIVLSVMMTFNFVVTKRALEEQLRSRVHDDFLDITQMTEDQDQQSLTREISERVSEPFFNDVYFFAADKTGQKIAGNVDAVSRRGGWQTLSLGSDSIEAKTTTVWGEVETLADGSFVFVGKDASQLAMTERALVLSYLGSAAVAGFLALTAAILLSRGFLRKLDAIASTSQAIIDGRLTERISVHNNSDEIDRLSSNLNRLFDSNQMLLTSLQQVTVDIAHDLRTPLSRLRNMLESARQQVDVTRTQRDNLDAAIAESDQLLETFSALLRIAQVESGSRRRKFLKFNLSDLGLKVFAIYQAVAEDAGKRLEAEITPEIYCEGDPELLLQLFVNLVENAIKHTADNTIISMKVVEPCRFEVSDNGPGIPKHLHGRVTERFFRLDRSRSTPGNGLGLALVAAVARIHNADLTISENEPGLCVRVEFEK